MGLTGSVVDAYRVQAAAGPAWTATAFTVCGWVTVDTSSTTREVFFSNFQSSVGGVVLRLWTLSGELNWVFPDSRALNTAINVSHANFTTGKRLFVYGSVDASGNGDVGHVFEGVGVNTSFVGGFAPKGSQSNQAPTIGGHSGGNSDQKLLGTQEDVRVYSARITLADILEIEASHGRYVPQPNALISRLALNQGKPGTDTDSIVPLDIADPTRVWAPAGVGNASVWAPSLAPLRRRS